MCEYVMLAFLMLIISFCISCYFTGALSPGVILSFVWVSILCCLLLSISNFDAINPNIYFYISTAVLSFCSASTCVSLILRSYSPASDMYFYNIGNANAALENKFKLANIFILISMPIYLYFLGFKPTVDFFTSIRAQLTENDGVLFGNFGRYGQLVMVVSFLICTLSNSKWTKIISIFCSFFINIPLLAKETFCLFFIPLAYYKLLTKSETIISTTRKYIIPFIIIVSLVMLIRFYESFDVEFISYMLNTYFLSSIPAFDQLTSHTIASYDFSHTLRSIYLLGNRFGTNNIIPPMLQDFVTTPYVTNVYTFLRPYYSDFGYSGLIVYPSIVGMFCGFIFELAKRGSVAALLFVSLLSYPIVFSFFDERFFTWMSQWIIFWFFCWYFSKDLRCSRQNDE